MPDSFGLQIWMYHADLVGGMAAQLAGRIPVVCVWHHTDLEPQDSKSLTIWTARLCGRLSRHLAAAIVCCSEASQRVHATPLHKREGENSGESCACSATSSHPYDDDTHDIACALDRPIDFYATGGSGRDCHFFARRRFQAALLQRYQELLAQHSLPVVSPGSPAA